MTRGSVNLGIVSKFDNKGVSKARKAFKKFGGAAAGIATGAVAAIGGIATAATRMASEFETSFAKIEGLVGISTAEIGKLEEAAIELGPKFGKSAQEAADALFFITSAGLEGEDAINVLEASLKGAAIGLGDTSTIADLATSAVNAYGASQLDGAKAVDVLTEAVREGKLEPSELAGAMGQVLPMASALGIGFDEVGAAMAAMSRTGTDAATASTQLRGILNSVIKPTSEAEATLSGLGLSAEGLREQMGSEGLLPTLETLTTAFDGNIEATADVFGNVRALTGVMDLMGTNVDSTREIFDNMTDDVLVLDDALAITQETAANKFAVGMETAKAALLPVGDTLLDIGASMLDDLMPTIELLAPLFEETFSHLEEPLGELAGLLPTLIESFMPLLPILGELVGMIVDLAVDLMPIFVGLMELLVPILDLLMPVLGVIVGLFDLLLIPIELLLMMLGPLVETILTPVTTAFELLSEGVGFLGETLAPLNDTIFPTMLEHLGEHFGPAIDGVKEGLRELTEDGFQHLIDQGILPVGFSLDMLALDTPGKMVGFANAIIGSFNTVIEVANALVSAIVNVINVLNEPMRQARARLGLSLQGIDKIDASKFQIATIDKMQVSDFLSDFDEVDVTGIGGNIDARFAKQIAEAQSATAGLSGPLATRATQTTGFRSAGLPMADGGIVDRATLAIIGEAGPEAVIPLDKMGSMGGGDIYITVNAGMGTSGPQVGQQIVAEIKRYERSSGRVFQSA